MNWYNKLVKDMKQSQECNSQGNLVDFDEDNVGCEIGERPEEDLKELSFD